MWDVVSCSFLFLLVKCPASYWLCISLLPNSLSLLPLLRFDEEKNRKSRKRYFAHSCKPGVRPLCWKKVFVICFIRMQRHAVCPFLALAETHDFSLPTHPSDDHPFVACNLLLYFHIGEMRSLIRQGSFWIGLRLCHFGSTAGSEAWDNVHSCDSKGLLMF